MSEDGDVTYVSENVSEFLGIQQVRVKKIPLMFLFTKVWMVLQIDMIGQQVWEYSHQCDHEELREILTGRRGSKDEQLNMHRDMLMRLKCTLTSRGRSVNIKSASYKVIFSKYI